MPEENVVSGMVSTIDDGRLWGRCAPNEALGGEKAASAVRLWQYCDEGRAEAEVDVGPGCDELLLFVWDEWGTVVEVAERGRASSIRTSDEDEAYPTGVGEMDRARG
jgi:hypothetical protein